MNPDFGRCPIFELTTHSPRIVNNHYHAHTLDSTRCYCAYEMQLCHFMPYYVTCIMRATCNISKSWIIIFSTYNFHSLYISCQYIKQAYINMIFTQTTGYLFFSTIPHKYNSQNSKTLVPRSKPSLKHSPGPPETVLKFFNIQSQNLGT